MTDEPNPEVMEWPREIWASGCDERDPFGLYVLSADATIARWEGDTERNREFQRYVDGDIHDTADRYWRERVTAAEARAERAEREADRLRDLIGRYWMNVSGCEGLGFTEAFSCTDILEDEGKEIEGYADAARAALRTAPDAARRAALAEMQEIAEDLKDGARGQGDG